MEDGSVKVKCNCTFITQMWFWITRMTFAVALKVAEALWILTFNTLHYIANRNIYTTSSNNFHYLNSAILQCKRKHYFHKYKICEYLEGFEFLFYGLYFLQRCTTPKSVITSILRNSVLSISKSDRFWEVDLSDSKRPVIRVIPKAIFLTLPKPKEK